MTSVNNIQEIKSLISLLDDPDEHIISAIKDEIIRRGPGITPWLKEALNTYSDGLVQKHLKVVIHKLHVVSIVQKLEKWVAMGQDNLLLGALIIARYQYPELKEENIIRRLGHITQDIYLRIKDDMAPAEKVKIVNAVLYDDYEFYGNKRDYQTPQCYYLNMLFDTGKGNHLSIGILYILVARSLGIPIVGVDLLDYFFLAYRENDKMLFYLNPFSKGSMLTQSELLFFLKLAEVDINQHQIEAADNLTIIRKLIIGLMESYSKLNKSDKVDELNKLLEIVIRKS